LLIGHERDPEIYRFLEMQGVPALVTWAYTPDALRPSVGFDNAAAMHEMAREVIKLGHRKFALISAQKAMNDRALARHKGIQDAMTEAGINHDSLMLIETNYNIDDGANAFAEIMQSKDRPTAVFCGNDVLAVGALRRAREMGMRVPDEVSIIGFDDIELAQVAYPALTTVHVPHREMGRRAALILANHVKNGTPINAVKLDAKLVFRETLGPVKPS